DEVLADLTGCGDVAGLAGIHDRLPRAGSHAVLHPDAVNVRVGGEKVLHRLLALRLIPVRVHLVDDLDVRVFFEDRAVPSNTHLIRRLAGDAVNGNDIAPAVQRLGQPFRTSGTPGRLVDANVKSIRRRNFSVSGDHQDPGFLCLGKDRVECGRAVGVYNDRV